MEKEQQHIDTVRGDGGSMPLGDKLLAELKSEVDLIAMDLKARCLEDSHPDLVRHAYWDGQSPDGLKHEDALKEQADPFEGSMDTRVRDVDMIINEDSMLCVAAAMRARITVTGRGANDTANAGKMQTTLHYFLRNRLGLQWMVEQCRLASFVHGSSPGLGFLSINWRKEEALELRSIAIDELRAMFVENAMAERMAQVSDEMDGVDPAVVQERVRADIEEVAQAFDLAVYDPSVQRESLVGILAEMFPELRPATIGRMAREMVAQIRSGEERPTVEFPFPYVKTDDLDIRALRVGGDMHLPVDTRDFQKSGIYLTVENLNRSALERRARAEEWKKEFTAAVLGTEESDGLLGKAVLRNYRRGGCGEPVATDGEYVARRYQILTAVMQLPNEEGIEGIYYVTFHYDLPMAAHDLRLSNYKHGKLPGVMYAREYISGCLTDSRGVSEIHGPAQSQRKTLLDGVGNNSIMAATPPVLTMNRKGKGRLWIKPMIEQQLNRDGQLKWMDPPKVPPQVLKALEMLGIDRDDYFGRSNAAIPEERTRLNRQFKVLMWLMHTREVMVQFMQLIQQFAPDELIARVTDSDGLPFMRSREEIQGMFDLDLQFDPEDLNIERLQTYGKIVKDIVLAMDANKTIDTTPLVSDLMYRLNPSIAPAAVKTVEEANNAQIRIAREMLTSVRNGVLPDLPTDGSVNYALILQWFQNLESQNPYVFQDLAEDKRIILTQLMEFLQFQTEQYGQNAQTGRTGIKTPGPAEALAGRQA